MAKTKKKPAPVPEPTAAAGLPSPLQVETPPVRGGLQELFVDELEASPANRNLGPIDELVESVRQVGVLQPVVVRPHPKDDARFQVVTGHRRVAAARAAGMTKVPALVRDLDDRQALEIQLVENLQRRDMHPLEEADGYHALIAQHGYNATAVALRMGKSRSYVAARLKLAELHPKVRALIEAGKLDVPCAQLVARIPVAELQVEAAGIIVANGLEGGARFIHASALVRDRFMLELSRAPFDLKDAELVPAAGACGPCPKRSGNAPDLFGDVKGRDLCTDPACFAAKRAKAWARLAAKAAEEGVHVLEGKKAEKALAHGSGWVDVDRETAELDGKSPRDLIRAHLPEITVAQRGDGQVVELVREKALAAALKAEGFQKRAPAKGAGQNQRAKELEAARHRRAAGRALVDVALAGVAHQDAEWFWAVLEAFVWDHVDHATLVEVAKRHELEQPARGEPRERLRNMITAKGAPKTLARTLVLELVLCSGMTAHYSTSLARGALEAALELLQIDPRKVASLAEGPAKTVKSPKRAKA